MAVPRSKQKSKKDAVVVREDPEDGGGMEKILNPLAAKLLKASESVTKVKPYKGDIPGYFSSRCYLLDLVLSGGLGFPFSKIIHVSGHFSSGKSLICMAAAVQVLEMGGVVFWFNQEDGWSWSLASMLGIQQSNPNFQLFPPMLAEKCFDSITHMIKELVSETTPVLFVLDSLGGCLTMDRDEKECETGRKIGDLQKLAKDFMAKTVPYIPFTMATLMITNHVYTDISAFTRPGMAKPDKATGGSAVPYRSWIELRTKAKPIVKSSTGKILHGMMSVKTLKNKGHIRELECEIPIFFKQRKNRVVGIDDAMTCVNYLVDSNCWKVGERGKQKVILTQDPEIFGNAGELRDRMLSDSEFYKLVRRLTEQRFNELNGLD